MFTNGYSGPGLALGAVTFLKAQPVGAIVLKCSRLARVSVSGAAGPCPLGKGPNDNATRFSRKEEMWKVYVGNLDSRVREMELADEFRVYGVVRSVWVARNPPGYAFIEFDNRRDADDAIAALDGKHGWRVEMSRRSTGGRSRGYNESRCHECGSSAHRTRDCRSRSSRSSHRRSISPYSRHRHSSPSRHSRSRSPGRDIRHRDRRSSPTRHSSSISPIWDARHRDSSPKAEHDRSSSPRIDHGHNRSENGDHSRSPQGTQGKSYADGSPRELHDCSRSQMCEQNESHQQKSSAANGGCSSPREAIDGSRSPNCEHSNSPQHDQNSPYANGSSPIREEHSNSKSS